MARKLRYLPAPETTFLVTMRAFQSRFLLRPSKELNDIVLGVIGRALALYPIMLHIVVMASNHFHFLLTTSSTKQLSDFMRYVNANIAREIGKLHRWRGSFWEDRYHAQPILDRDEMVRRVDYLLAHGCKEGLVLSPADWPGINCLEALVDGAELEGTWYDRSKEYEARRAGRKVPFGHFATRYPVKLQPLPFLAGDSEQDQRDWYRELVASIEQRTRERLTEKDYKVLGRQNVFAMDPHHMPEQTKRSPQPACLCSRLEDWKEYCDAYREFAARYRAASCQLRNGVHDVVFPENCFPPPAAYTGSTETAEAQSSVLRHTEPTAAPVRSPVLPELLACRPRQQSAGEQPTPSTTGEMKSGPSRIGKPYRLRDSCQKKPRKPDP